MIDDFGFHLRPDFFCRRATFLDKVHPSLAEARQVTLMPGEVIKRKRLLDKKEKLKKDQKKKYFQVDGKIFDKKVIFFLKFL